MAATIKLEVERLKEENLQEALLAKKGLYGTWLDVSNIFGPRIEYKLLINGVIVLLEKFRLKSIKNIEVLATCEAAGNTLISFAGLLASTMQGDMFSKDLSIVTFNKTLDSERPKNGFHRGISTPSHQGRKRVISVNYSLLENKRVLMLDDVLRQGGTAAGIKEMVEVVKGEFLGLGVFFRKMWEKDQQIEKLGNIPIISLVECNQPDS
jgi:adenine/guanine phosphoribosyltransferase-like PRPP-binding protein